MPSQISRLRQPRAVGEDEAVGTNATEWGDFVGRLMGAEPLVVELCSPSSLVKWGKLSASCYSTR